MFQRYKFNIWIEKKELLLQNDDNILLIYIGKIKQTILIEKMK